MQLEWRQLTRRKRPVVVLVDEFLKHEGLEEDTYHDWVGLGRVWYAHLVTCSGVCVWLI